MKGFAILGLLMAGVGHVQGQSAADLIRSLTTPPPETLEQTLGIFSCGTTEAQREANRKDREAAESLVKMGSAAVPELGGTMAMGPYNAGLLLHVYARIQGPAALPRLRMMIRNPDLDSLQSALADSAALSLGLTGYVPARGILGRIFYCRGPVPRDGFNQFIRAWERNDPLWLERNLGSRGRDALDAMLKSRTWDRMRSELWPGKSGDDVAVGYRIDIAGSWSAPEETLGDKSYSKDAPLNRVDPELMTDFKTASGADCGKFPLKFVGKGMLQGFATDGYAIDNSDLEDLLRLIAACAEAK